MKLLLVLTLLLTSACAASESKFKGEVDFVDSTPVSIKWVSNPPPGLKGNTVLQVKDGIAVCTIYAEEPDNWADDDGFITLGHEFLHCFKGNWHKHTELYR